jgi:hypothetical protein
MSNKTKKLAAIAVSKSLCKEYSTPEYNRVVYLKNNQEFQINLFNPYDYVIAAKISIDGKEMQNSLVLNPGERVWLERPLGYNDHKFKFETYNVDMNDNDVKKAIANNGEIRIKFYKEDEDARSAYYVWDNSWDFRDNNNYNKHGNEFLDKYNLIYNKSENTWLNTSYPVDYDGPRFKSLGNVATNTALTNNIATMDSYDINTKSNVTKATFNCSDIRETGRIGEGNKSNQKFKKINKQFSYWPFETVFIKLLPESEKQYSGSDLKKVYCCMCGRKLKSNYKFCPYCGTEID